MSDDLTGAELRTLQQLAWPLQLPTDMIAAVAAIKRAGAEQARTEIVSGVRAWCAINEIAAPPLDWAGLGEYLAARSAGSEVAQ